MKWIDRKTQNESRNFSKSVRPAREIEFTLSQILFPRDLEEEMRCCGNSYINYRLAQPVSFKFIACNRYSGSLRQGKMLN